VGNDAVISLDHVTFHYPLGEEPALKDVSCEFKVGKLYGVVGANGSGKTTLALLISGFATTVEKGELEGDVVVAGRSIEKWEEGELASTVGYVLQNPFNQISGSRETVFEEIRFGLENLGVDPEDMERRIVAIAEETSVTDLLLKNPFELSGGQQQRVALASVLVMEPDILVIDEPTSQLDPAGTEDIFHIISKLKNEGKTIILVEHKVDLLAEYADEIIVLEDGRLIAHGSTKEVLGDFSLLDHGVQLPQVSLLARELQARGVDVPFVPTHYDEAKVMFRELANLSGCDTNE
jgi:energy-coupling factor transport system ATP-binding protein